MHTPSKPKPKPKRDFPDQDFAPSPDEGYRGEKKRRTKPDFPDQNLAPSPDEGYRGEKKMADGGPTYPFYNNQPIQNTTTPSVVQKFVSPTPMMPAPGQNLIRNPMQNQGMNQQNPQGMKKGGRVKKLAKGGTASSRADGIAQRGKTKGRLI